jgi:hypothetical protein
VRYRARHGVRGSRHHRSWSVSRPIRSRVLQISSLRRAHGAARHRQDGRHHRAHVVRRALPCAQRGARRASNTADPWARRQQALDGDPHAPCQAGRRGGQLPQCPLQERSRAAERRIPDAVGSGSRTRQARAAHQAALMPALPSPTFRLLRHGMARRSDAHPTSVTARPPTTGIADGTHPGIRKRSNGIGERHGPTGRNACALRR